MKTPALKSVERYLARQSLPGEPEGWSAAEERAFREWYQARARQTGTSPDPDDPLHYYDYRAAYRGGAEPLFVPEVGMYEWPSKFKRLGHPNLIVDGNDTRTDTPAAADLATKATTARLLANRDLLRRDLSSPPLPPGARKL